MQLCTRLLTLGFVAIFLTGCWSEPIQIRKADETDQIPFASKSKAQRDLMEKLGKARGIAFIVERRRQQLGKAPATEAVKPAEGAAKPAEGAQ